MRCGASATMPERGTIIDLSYTRFDCRLELSGFILPTIEFIGSRFNSHVSLSGCLFLGHAIFDESTFGKLLTFNRGKCRFGFSVSGIEAHGKVRISGVHFSGDLDFDRCDLRKDVRVQEVECAGGLYVNSSTFRQHAKFIGVKVRGNADWSEASFEGRFKCIDSQLALDSSFAGCTFSEAANFNGTKFEGEQFFQTARFLEGVSFESVSFQEASFFNNVLFGANPSDLFASLDFRNARWKAPANFEGANCNGWYPRLRGATFEEEATFTAEDENWDVSIPDVAPVPEYVLKEAKEGLAKLRHRMTSQGLPEEEHFFFRREMGFAGQIDPWGAGLPYRVFGAVSDFGQSILRPAMGLLALWVVGALIYTISYAWGAFDDGQQPSEMFFGFGLSFANIFKFLGLQRSYFDVEFTQSLNPWLQVMGGFQTVAGFILLFFLGLGLRTRFRMR